MNLKVALKIFIWGRKSVRSELYQVKIAAIKRNGRKSFLSGKIEQNEWHHVFDVTTWPIFAASSWNIVCMTKKEHAAYHKWNGGTQSPCNPLTLIYWSYFIWHWWKGWGLLLLIVIVFYLANQAAT